MTKEEISQIADINEGLENSIKLASTTCKTIDEIVEKVSTKRYTKTRISRILTYILLDITKSEMEQSKNANQYIRVLGINKKYEGILKKINNDKLITSLKKFEENNGENQLLNIDKKATEITKTAEEEIQKEAGDLKKVSEKLGKKVMYLTTGGMVSQMNIDGGRASAATKLKKGEVGKSFVSANGDSYFIVKLLDKNKTEVSYESLQIPMTEFETRMKKIQASGKIKEYIAKE